MNESTHPVPNGIIQPDPLIKELHDLRKQINGCIQKAGRYKIGGKDIIPITTDYWEAQKKMQREISLVYTKLQEAKHWVNECLLKTQGV